MTNRANAERVQRRLEQAGVSAETHECPPLGRGWFASRASGGLSVEVPADEFERGYRVLLDWSATERIPGVIRCPECQSFRVDYPQFTRKSLLTNVAMGLVAKFRLVEWEYYCEDCHFTWPKEGTRRSAERPHMAPYYFIEGIAQRPDEAHEQSKKEAA